DAVTRIGTAGRNGHINFYGGFLNGAISTINGSFAVSPVGIAMSSAGMTNQIPTVGIGGNYDEQRWSSYAGSGSFFVGSTVGPGAVGSALSGSATAARALPAALQTGNNARGGVSVYAGISQSGDDIYTGITTSLGNRASQHG